jgi:hypothetical protein
MKKNEINSARYHAGLLVNLIMRYVCRQFNFSTMMSIAYISFSTRLIIRFFVQIKEQIMYI